jgi:small subunit ribosomal protein S18
MSDTQKTSKKTTAPIFQKKIQKKRQRNELSALKTKAVDYKNIKLLTKFISVFERILPARVVGSKVRHQKLINTAIKRARYMALLPYSLKHTNPKGARKF